MLTNYPFLSRKQKGSALITVLVIVVVVTILGITAMRMSITGLRLATNSQAGNLLFQAADLGLQQFTNGITGGVAGADIGVDMNPGGILGNVGTETALCLSTRGANWGSGATQVEGFSAGACTVGTPAQYVSGRNLAVTQVNYLRRPQYRASSNSDTTDLSASLGSSNVALPPPDIVIVSSTSIMPTLGSADLNTINGCLGNASDDSFVAKSTTKDDAEVAAAAAVVTITDCLTDSGAIFVTHQEEFLVGLVAN